MTKKEARILAKEKLKVLSESDRGLFSKKIAQRIINMPDFLRAKSIFIYKSYMNEVDTNTIICETLRLGKKVYLPVVLGDKMELVAYNQDTELQKGAFGIEEPLGAPVSEKCDLAIIPLLAFDENGHRLGKGGGYYDRFLANFDGTSIGIAFSCQQINDFDFEAHDISPDYIITEK